MNYLRKIFVRCILLALGLSCTGSTAIAQYTLITLATFNGTNGAHPSGGLFADAGGNLYGTAQNGGSSGDGTVFELAVGANMLSTLATFNNTNGAGPHGALIADASGNLYGEDGNSIGPGGGANGDGTVFEIATDTHILSTLATFNGTNGQVPYGGLVADAAGNLYGVTNLGGANNKGTVFKLAAGTHTLSTLVTFNGSNGDLPFASLTIDASGNLYGTTADGGGVNGNAYGTVFEVAAGTHAFSTLAIFTYQGNIGAGPYGNLLLDSHGNLYGTTVRGGNLALNNGNGYGTVFKVAAGTHILSTLASFNGANGDGPEAGLIADAAGNLYGTTTAGGNNNNGEVFELAAATNSLTTLASFNGLNGSNLACNLVADSAGNLFGTTVSGGANNLGTVFELSPVPEPSTIVLAGCGLTTLALAALRRKSR
jgi:uncharacterized repeat protein (TIGR03803 family)